MFKLLRYFSITSLICIVMVIIALSFFYRHLSYVELLKHEERSNVAITRSLANAIWKEYLDFFHNAQSYSVPELQVLPEVKQLRADVLRLMKDLDIVKVKIFSLDGRTIFSTDITQIGQDRSDNSGFLSAKSGIVASAVNFKDSVDAFDKVRVNRNLVSSYIPISNGTNERVQVVMEVYSDVTDLISSLNSTQSKIISGVLISLLTLYLSLLLIVRRADTILKANEKRIHFMAYHDPLTGLANRRLMMDRITLTLHQADRENRLLALLFVDLDGFKEVNDSLGHEAGDLLLKKQADRLSESVRKVDTIARFGGDEFVILISLKELDNEENRLPFVEDVAGRVLECLNKPITIMGETVTVTGSIGISIYPHDGEDADSLLKNADSAMYSAKRNRKTQICYHSDHTQSGAKLSIAAST